MTHCRSDVVLPACDRWEERLVSFSAAGSALIDSRALDRRAVEKFIHSVESVAALLGALRLDYRIVEAARARVATYRTLYFDTPALTLFHAHRRGVRVRHKVRVRSYPDREVTRFEVKTRHAEQLSTKQTRDHAHADLRLSDDDRRLAAMQTGVTAPFAPLVFTDFHRITLVGTDTTDRVTIDFDLVVGNVSHRLALGRAAIVEIKRAPGSFPRCSSLSQALRDGGWRRASVSKYAAAVALLQPSIAQNSMIPGLRTLRQVAA